MRLTQILQASPLLLSVLLAATGCGSKVIAGGGTGGNGGTGGTAGEFAACTYPGDCVLTHTGCCEGCGAPDLSNQAAVNVSQVDAYFTSQCPAPVPCPKCASIINPNLFAYCDSGACKAADVTKDAISACTTDADCRLRYGTGCCEPCSADTSGLIAVNVNSNVAALTCGPDIACPACAPTYPVEAAAICDAGHCAVILAGG